MFFSVHCPAGKIVDEGTVNCVLCPEFTYKAVAGLGKCLICSTDYKSDENKTVCDKGK